MNAPGPVRSAETSRDASARGNAPDARLVSALPASVVVDALTDFPSRLVSPDHWVSCAPDVNRLIARSRHVVARGAITTACGATASTPRTWRPHVTFTKPRCGECLRAIVVRDRFSLHARAFGRLLAVALQRREHVAQADRHLLTPADLSTSGDEPGRWHGCSGCGWTGLDPATFDDHLCTDDSNPFR